MNFLEKFLKSPIDHAYYQSGNYDLVLENKDAVDQSDVFINSYPRSGNTWLRLMMCDAILNSQDQELGSFPTHISPTITKHSIRDLKKEHENKMLIKTHSFRDIPDRNKFIYIYRNPVDSLVSFYRFTKKRPIEPNEAELVEFCINHFEGWEGHLAQAIERSKNGIIFRYEDLVEKGAHQYLDAAMKFFGLSLDQKNIDFAVSNQTIENQRQRQTSRKSESAAGNQWRLAHGKAGGNTKYLDDELTNRLQSKAKKILKRIDKITYTI